MRLDAGYSGMMLVGIIQETSVVKKLQIDNFESLKNHDFHELTMNLTEYGVFTMRIVSNFY